MFAVIPLAGPDFYSEQFGIRPLSLVDGEPLLIRALSSRPWMRNQEVPESNVVFVTRRGTGQPEFGEFVSKQYPKAKMAVISDCTGGALLSALAGSSLITQYREPIVVDLIDIFYELPDYSGFAKMFAGNQQLAGILPYFTSSEPCYSYLELSGEKVLRTREKEVISNAASAGTYFFRDLSFFLRAVASSVEAFPQLAVNNLLYLCPSYNGLIESGYEVIGTKAVKVNPVSKRFHV